MQWLSFFGLSSRTAIKFRTTRGVLHDWLFYGEVFPRLQVVSLTGLCICAARLLALCLSLLVATVVIRCRGWCSRWGGLVFGLIVGRFVVVRLVICLLLVLFIFILIPVFIVLLVFVVVLALVLFSRLVFIVGIVRALRLF